MTSILEVNDLRVDFYQNGAVSNSALRGVSFSLEPGKTLGVVGETGCGKTLTGMAIMGLLPPSAKRSGTISLDGTGFLTAETMASVRGSQISVIFQNPHSAFNPVFTIGSQLRLVALKRGIARNEVEDVLTERLLSVGLRDTARVISSYPHQLSGGMLQRCMIAMALISRPKLLIADEPTTALDSTIGKQVLELIKGLQEREGFAMLFISHDVTVVSEVSDDVAVLYAGKIVEYGPSTQVMNSPSHPYSQGLLGAIPSAAKPRGKLSAIRGSVPANTLEIVGCAFSPRCPYSFERCAEEPQLLSIGSSSKAQSVACWRTR
ncbi:MAG: ABC transporter ATP-binding protein [Candidatus Nanopelagicaceae bacterium]|jgi:peptide/nickel transport system ATP-binding protein